MRSVWLIMLLGIGVCSAQEPPKTMTVIVAKLSEPEQDPASFAAQSKKIWRAGTKYARMEEAPDLTNHIHGLLIVKEPDAWLINLFEKSGRHVVDPGPTFNARLPIFDPSSGANAVVSELEFGRELEFFKKNNATSSAADVGKAATRYDLTVGDNKLTFWIDAKSKKPIRLSLTAITAKKQQTFEYLTYDEDVQFDPSLFLPPPDIAISD